MVIRFTGLLESLGQGAADGFEAGRISVEVGQAADQLTDQRLGLFLAEALFIKGEVFVILQPVAEEFKADGGDRGRSCRDDCRG